MFRRFFFESLLVGLFFCLLQLLCLLFFMDSNEILTIQASSNKNHFENLLTPTLIANSPEVVPSLKRVGTYELAHDQRRAPKKWRILGVTGSSISGSGQFSDLEFQWIKSEIKKKKMKKLYVVDLRQEAHGFVNGNAVSWYAAENNMNWGKSKEEIIQDEAFRLQALLEEKYLWINRFLEKENSSPSSLDQWKWQRTQASLQVQNVESEEAFLLKKQSQDLVIKYVRLPVADFHAPSVLVVKQFISLLKQVDPKTEWIHLHCSAGKGRTTSFMALYLMLHKKKYNKKFKTDKEIMQFLKEEGGADLYGVDPRRTLRRTEAARARREFLENFYLFAPKVP